MHDRDAYREDREAELGYAEVSARELRLRDWEITRGDRDFEALVKRLRDRKYRVDAHTKPELADRLERIRANARAWAARNSAYQSQQRRKFIARKKAARRLRDAPVITCQAADCGATWCRMPDASGPKPRFCSAACQMRAYYQARNPQRRQRGRRKAWLTPKPPRVRYRRAGAEPIEAAPRREGG